MEFIDWLLKVPAETVVQGQLARHLPAILGQHTPGCAAVAQRLSVARRNAVVLSQQKTRPGAADAGSRGKHLSVQRLRSLRPAVPVRRGEIRFRDVIGGVVLPFAAELEG